MGGLPGVCCYTPLSGTGKSLRAVWVHSSGEAFVVGDDGAILRRKP